MLEAWRQPDRSGVERVYYGIRVPKRDGLSLRYVQLGADAPTIPEFAQREDGEQSVLFGPVDDGVNGVLVEACYPTVGAPERAELVGETDLGRFFVHTFDVAVEQARVTCEPSDRWSRSIGWAHNLRLQHRRQIAEGVVIGTGRTPAGQSWRLRVWKQRPDQLMVDLQTADDPARFELFDRMGVTGSGYGGPPVAADRLIKLSSTGGAEGHVIGEVAPSAGGVRVRLQDGAETDAEIIKTDLVANNYFVAFSPKQIVIGVVAVDDQGHVLGEDMRSEDTLRRLMEFRRRVSSRG